MRYLDVHLPLQPTRLAKPRDSVLPASASRRRARPGPLLATRRRSTGEKGGATTARPTGSRAHEGAEHGDGITRS